MTKKIWCGTLFPYSISLPHVTHFLSLESGQKLTRVTVYRKRSHDASAQKITRVTIHSKRAHDALPCYPTRVFITFFILVDWIQLTKVLKFLLCKHCWFILNSWKIFLVKFWKNISKFYLFLFSKLWLCHPVKVRIGYINRPS